MNSVVRWNPIRNFVSVQDELERVFGRTWQTDDNGARLWQAPVDIEEQPDRYTLHLELPGLKLEDIKITLEDNTLSIRGEKTRTEEQKNATYHRLQPGCRPFARTVRLSHPVEYG